jgi:hypothetical protein
MIATKTFALAGNATFTVTSKRTGTRYTYKVQASDDGNMHFVSVLSGPDNWTNYRYFGLIRNGQFHFANPAKAKVSAEAPSAKGFAWLWNHIDADLSKAVEVHHEGKCCCCGRKLTVPQSIITGIGPECAKKMGF